MQRENEDAVLQRTNVKQTLLPGKDLKLLKILTTS